MPTQRRGPSVSPAQAQANPFPARYRDAVVMSDTTPEAKAIQEEALRNMTGKQRLLLAWDMSLFARKLPAPESGKSIRIGLKPGCAGTPATRISSCAAAFGAAMTTAPC
jgi:hypothetical protein